MPFNSKHYAEINKSLVELIRKNLYNYDNNTKQTKRIKLQQCKYCYYISNKISLQAFTIFICKNCLNPFQHHNSNVNKYCIDCAKELNICCHCGAEMDSNDNIALKSNNEIITPNYKKRDCSECMDFKSSKKFNEQDWEYICGKCRPFACEMFKVDYQTC